MLQRVRCFFSATLVAVLLVSTLILSKPVQVVACPEEPPPATLLSLYLQSDLIFTANITGEKDGEILTDEEDYSYVEVVRNLKITSVWKGKPARDFAFGKTEYRYKKAAEEPIDVAETEEYYTYGYKGYSKLKVGEKYLFFFRKDAETGKYILTDEISGHKKLSDADLSVHKERIDELKSIVKRKENQVGAITDWLVRCIEEPATRWDGAFDLSASFESLEYLQEEESVKDIPFALNKDFSSSTPEIAQNLSDAQKNYISSIAFDLIRQEMSGDGKFDDFYYSLPNLAKRWDKSRIVMYAFSFLQISDKTDAEKTGRLMGYVSTLLGDDELLDLFYQFSSDENSPEKIEEINNSETEVVNESENKTEETVETIQKTEQIAETKTESVNEDDTEEQKLTPAQKREKILQKFIERYEYLLARGFPARVDNELADTQTDILQK